MRDRSSIVQVGWCVHWTVQRGVLQTWLIPQSPAIVMLFVFVLLQSRFWLSHLFRLALLLPAKCRPCQATRVQSHHSQPRLTTAIFWCGAWYMMSIYKIRISLLRLICISRYITGGYNTNTPQSDKAMSYGGLFTLDEECLQYKLFDARTTVVIWKGCDPDTWSNNYWYSYTKAMGQYVVVQEKHYWDGIVPCSIYPTLSVYLVSCRIMNRLTLTVFEV